MNGVPLGALANRVGGEVRGNAELRVVAVRTLDKAGPEDLSFYHNRRYLEDAKASRAGALLVADAAPFPERNLIVCAEPYAALATLIELFNPVTPPPPGIHPAAEVASTAVVGDGASVGAHAVIGERASIGTRAAIGAGCVVGDDVVIGDDTVLHPNVVVEHDCQLGARCVVHAGTVIGSDGFGFATSSGIHRKVPQVGTVVVEDDVELGANVCIDRATLGETRIGRGTKVDNLVQIGHNVQVGENSLLVAQVALAGSARVGRNVVMAGKSGAVGHVTVADGTVVTGKSGVTQDTAPGEVISGWPGRPHREWLKAMSNLFRLEELRRRVKALEDAVKRPRGGND